MTETHHLLEAAPVRVSHLLSATPPRSSYLDPHLLRAVATRIAAQAPSRNFGPLRLDSYVMSRTLRTGHFLPNGPFQWSPRAAQRIIGGPASRLVLSGSCRNPREAVELELQVIMNQSPATTMNSGSLAQWLTEAPPSLRLCVVAEATTYATELLTSFDAASIEGSVIGKVSDPQWAVPGAPWISLRGRRDLEVASHSTPRQRSLLALRKGLLGPDAGADLGFVALCAALSRPDDPLPSKIVGLWPACGRVFVLDVDTDTIKSAARNVVNCVEIIAASERHTRAA